MDETDSPRFQTAVFEVIGREHAQAIASLHELEEGIRKFWTTYSVGLTIADDETVAAMGGTLEEAIQLRTARIQVSLARRVASKTKWRRRSVLR